MGPVARTSRWYLGSLFTWLATAEDTGGAFSLAEVRVPRGCEPPPHVHAHEDEAYAVLDGRMRFTVDGEVVDTGPGDFVFLPRGKVHGFEVLSDVAHLMITMSPGGGEAAFLALSEPAPSADLPPRADGPPPPEVIEAVLGAHTARGVTFVGPPPSTAGAPAPDGA